MGFQLSLAYSSLESPLFFPFENNSLLLWWVEEWSCRGEEGEEYKDPLFSNYIQEALRVVFVLLHYQVLMHIAQLGPVPRRILWWHPIGSQLFTLTAWNSTFSSLLDDLSFVQMLFSFQKCCWNFHLSCSLYFWSLILLKNNSLL